MIAFPHILDPDQCQYNVGPVLDPNCLDTDNVHKEVLEIVSRQSQSMKNYSALQKTKALIMKLHISKDSSHI